MQQEPVGEGGLRIYLVHNKQMLDIAISEDLDQKTIPGFHVYRVSPEDAMDLVNGVLGAIQELKKESGQ